ncbi:hypothetical protein EDB83DRAFT_1577024 [Lactarius deliciosus]|nr:hypothetical protein EDB83DRAFT_1577024 [Lactarius deliciosus]
MPALLHAFPSAPLVVRRRAKELFDIIRAAVKKGLSGPAVPSESTPAVSSEVTPESRKDDHVSSEPAATSLWSRNKPLPTSTTSSRFGATAVLPCLLSSYSTSQSSLFGVPPTSAVPQTKTACRFQDVVNRIRSTLVVALTVHRARV